MNNPTPTSVRNTTKHQNRLERLKARKAVRQEEEQQGLRIIWPKNAYRLPVNLERIMLETGETTGSENPSNAVKRCWKCKTEFPATVEYFYQLSRGKRCEGAIFKLSSTCKSCQKGMVKASQQRRKEQEAYVKQMETRIY